MGQSNVRVPVALSSNPEDVTVALEAAATLWENGDQKEALRWLGRAAEAAGAAGDDLRAVAIQSAAADPGISVRRDCRYRAQPAPKHLPHRLCAMVCAQRALRVRHQRCPPRRRPHPYRAGSGFPNRRRLRRRDARLLPRCRPCPSPIPFRLHLRPRYRGARPRRRCHRYRRPNPHLRRHRWSWHRACRDQRPSRSPRTTLRPCRRARKRDCGSR